MATETPNLKLKNPQATDFYNIEDFNGNFDKIDGAFAKLSTTTVEHTIPHTAWNSGRYIFSSALIKSATQDIELVKGKTMTKEQLLIAQGANIVSTAQAAGSLTLECYGDVPSVDLPVAFVIRGDA